MQEYGREDLAARQEVLSRIASALKFAAETYSIPVLVTNQARTLLAYALAHVIAAITRARASSSEWREVQVLGKASESGGGGDPSTTATVGPDAVEVVDAERLVIPALGNT